MGYSRGHESGKSEQIRSPLRSPAHIRDDRGLDDAPSRGPGSAEVPTTVAQCANGGWKEFGFPDYGACIVFVLSRPPGSREDLTRPAVGLKSHSGP